MEAPKKPLYKSLYFQVICAILLGIALGHFYPQTAQAMKPLGDGFIKLIKMIIAPIIFCTVVLGVAGMEDMKKLGRIGGKALIYFEAVTTLALIIGLVVVNTLQPGGGMHVDPASLDTTAIAKYTASAQHNGFIDFLMNIIPGSPMATSSRCCSFPCSAARPFPPSASASPVSSGSSVRLPRPCSASSTSS